MNRECAGLIFDDSIHYLDHLAPFCAQMGWPLIVCDETVAHLCRQFYPMTEVIHTDFTTLDLPPCIVSCNTRPSVTLALGPFSSWKGRLIWLPHGQSDKGWKSPFFEALGGEDLLLVYGQRMRQVLQAKQIALPQISVGNFRWAFYQTHYDFYNNLIDKRIGKNNVILYAPTWDDSEQNSSFWTVFDTLINAVPSHQYLLIKIHPNLEKMSPAKFEWYKAKVDRLPNVSLLNDFPPVYPLLDRSLAYIGDMSSVGYDYLRFGRPLFFLTKQVVDPAKTPHTFLMQSGEQIPFEEIPHLFSRIHTGRNQTGLNTLAFDERTTEQTKHAIHQWTLQWK